MATGVTERSLVFQAPVEVELAQVDAEIGRLFDASEGLIAEVGQHVLAAAGKRLRPTLLLLAARRDGSVPENALLAGAVVELIHMATLIHDDSVDQSLLRRGMPTINSMFSDQVSVIMGDYVYSKAFAMMMQRGLFDEMTILSVTAHVMSRGEMHQIERKFRLDATVDDYFEVIDEKTASLFAAACRIGAGLRGSTALDAWHEFGREYGRAFQITDDLFDFIGDQEVMGKAAGSDIRGGRVTLPLIAALAHAAPHERRRAEAIVAGGVRDADWAELVGWIGRHGGVDACFERARQHAARAQGVLATLDADPDAREALAACVEQVVSRRR